MQQRQHSVTDGQSGTNIAHEKRKYSIL